MNMPSVDSSQPAPGPGRPWPVPAPRARASGQAVVPAAARVHRGERGPARTHDLPLSDDLLRRLREAGL